MGLRQLRRPPGCLRRLAKPYLPDCPGAPVPALLSLARRTCALTTPGGPPCSGSLAIGVRLRLEWVFDFGRNDRSASVGIGVRDQSESAPSIARSPASPTNANRLSRDPRLPSVRDCRRAPSGTDSCRSAVCWPSCWRLHRSERVRSGRVTPHPGVTDSRLRPWCLAAASAPNPPAPRAARR